MIKIKTTKNMVKYVYNSNGKIEYALIPYMIWKKIKIYIDNDEIVLPIKNKKEFNPSEYRGMLSHLNLDIEQEIKNLRNQWTRNI